MRNFVKALITNRFGIVLAALNLCYFVSGAAFANFKFNIPSNNFEVLMRLMHFPAALPTVISAGFLNFLFSAPNNFIYYRFAFPIFLFFVTFQWLFIAWTAKTIAGRIRPANV